jgi:hypothetical protein
MRSPRIRSAATLAVAIAAHQTGAARPFQTDDAGTVAQGTTELEAGAQYWSDFGDFSAGLKHGLTQRLDLGIYAGWASLPHAAREFKAANLGLKLALVPSYVSASFANELGSSDYTITGILSLPLGDFSLNANIGAEFIAKTGNHEPAWGVQPQWNAPFGTVGAELRGDDGGPDWWQVGTQLKLRPWLAVDAGIGTSLQGTPKWTATTGAWIALP